jgi:hypothetical protein
MIASALVVAWSGQSGPAWAQEAQPGEAPAAPEASLGRARPVKLEHTGQVGLALMPGIGYRVIARYNDEQFCLDDSQDDSKWVCTNDVPFFMDLSLSYGVTSRVDLLAEVRLGIGKDEAAGVGRQLAFFPGVRFWLDRDVRLKFYTTIQAVIDRTKQSQDKVRDVDWGLRNANGLMYDAIRNLGFYVQVGETLAVVRWFRIEIDAGLGLQVRFP